jgi:glutamate-1-semialdehyde 2,1-aminomutase
MRRDRIRKLIAEELDAFQQRTPRSLQLCRRAVNASMPLGVPTGVCALDPYPVAIREGRGSHVIDADGNDYVDYHNGFGTTVFGHAHPLITDAIRRQAARGTHFGALTEPVISWAEHLCDRYQLDWVRFSPSGTEATMDAIRIARAHTGRVRVAKIEGGYHGSHEVALQSPNLPLDGTEGPDDAPATRPNGEGLSPRLAEEVVALPFNDLDAAARALGGGDVACVLVEPILMNVGTIWPQPGYLQGLRELCDIHGSVLIFDETKTGATIAWGGAEELFGVRPHMKTLGKGIGGGLPAAALGDTDGRMFELIESWRVPHLGTFNGNPATAAAGLVALTEVLTPDAYDRLEAHRQRLTRELNRIIADYELPAYVIGAGAKGCVVWADPSQGRLVNFRDYRRRFDFDAAYLTWLWLMNRGVFLAPGQDEQWTHSIAHTDTDADRFAGAFAELARALRA